MTRPTGGRCMDVGMLRQAGRPVEEDWIFWYCDWQQ